MRTIISGSLAYDTIFTFSGSFAGVLGSSERINRSFAADGMHKDFGGCAANIAWAMKQLGADPCIWAALGSDGAEYIDHLKNLGIDVSEIKLFDSTYSAQALITTDSTGSQLCTFFGGAMDLSHELAEPRVQAEFGIVSPGGRAAMPIHAEIFKKRGMKVIFDPGQALPLFSADALVEMAEGSFAVLLSEYERTLFKSIAGVDASAVDGVWLIETKGRQGALAVSPRGEEFEIAPVPAEEVDPVGAGDAFRGGLLFGLEKGLGIVEAARIGAVMGAAKVSSRGGHNYRTSLDEAKAAHLAAYGLPLEV